ncbi:unnamed protein product [Pleuronectes platessa]|uniref:Uncharacterized protein n=1 Tax=Pleuronectes platessa TaxID=8262 RepID=A0A9N7ZCI5_PLEPL|nr:unnamed protein product [Pleuronectes platessa]
MGEEWSCVEGRTEEEDEEEVMEEEDAVCSGKGKHGTSQVKVVLSGESAERGCDLIPSCRTGKVDQIAGPTPAWTQGQTVCIWPRERNRDFSDKKIQERQRDIFFRPGGQGGWQDGGRVRHKRATRINYHVCGREEEEEAEEEEKKRRVWSRAGGLGLVPEESAFSR